MSLQPTLKITEHRQRKSTRPGGLGRGEEIAVRAPPHCRSLSHLRRRQPAAMASRKLLLSLTAGRRGLEFRATSRLLSASNLQEVTASRPLAAAATTKSLGGSPAALLFASRAVYSTRMNTQSGGDAPSPASSEHKFVFLDLAVLNPFCVTAYSPGVSMQILVRGDSAMGESLKHI
jgi:hypothetical protein